MIESLTLTNFQKHSNFTLHLSPTITTIVGGSDQGKTSLLRGMRWVTLNLPWGASFTQRGKPFCLATLKVDGHSLARKRQGASNLYSLDGQSFVSFNREVPHEIASLLNLGEVNFQKQLEGPYWFLLSPGQVSRELNSVINLDVIDRVLSSLSSEVKRTKLEVELSKERLERAREERDSLSGVEEMDRELRELEQIDTTLRENLSRRSRIEELLSEGGETGERIDRLSCSMLGGLESKLARLEGMAGDLRGLKQRRTRLWQLLREGRSLRDEIGQRDSELEKVEGELHKLTQVCPICGSPRSKNSSPGSLSS